MGSMSWEMSSASWVTKGSLQELWLRVTTGNVATGNYGVTVCIRQWEK